MRRAALGSILIAVLIALGVAAPGAAAAKPGPPKAEHGVNRAKLAKKAKRKIEFRRSVEVLKISRCGPRKRKRKPRLDFSRWVCEWRAEGIWPGQVPYHCAGKAVWKRKKNRWRIDPCRNRLQPQAPLLEVPNPHPGFGFNDNWIFQSQKAVDLLDASAGRIARTSLPWGGVERFRGAGYDWYGSDLLYERLLAQGIRPLWVLLDAPCFAQPDPAACERGENQHRPSPQHYDEFAAFAVAAARRYPEAVGVEVWNEPNYPLFWGGWPEPDKYAKMLRDVADAVHAGAPGMPVVSGGLSPHADSDKNAIGFSNFLDKMYKFGAAQRADAIGIHPYPGVGPSEDYIADVRVYLGKIQRVMQAHGDAARPMWATEFGVSTTGPHAFDPNHQASALQELYTLFRHIDRIEVAIVHRFVEEPDLGGREGGFGVLTNQLQPKPAYCALGAVRGVELPAGLC